MKNLARIGLAAVSLLAFSLSSASTGLAAGIKIGSLVCDVSGGIGLILGSNKSVRCSFNRSSGGNEYYAGSITKFGLDIGVTQQATMAWIVIAPGQTHDGALAGSYVGATAEATVGAGVGANALIGGFNESITLQPLSVQAQTGLNVAAGVASLNLRAQ